MEDATSHYRAIRYTMGPLNVVCRFEADAYDDGIIPDDLTQTEAAAVRGANEGGLAERGKFTYNAPIRVLQKGHIACSLQGCVEAGAETEPRSGACERGKERADCTACDGGEKCGCG